MNISCQTCYHGLIEVSSLMVMFHLAILWWMIKTLSQAFLTGSMPAGTLTIGNMLKSWSLPFMGTSKIGWVGQRRRHGILLGSTLRERLYFKLLFPSSWSKLHRNWGLWMNCDYSGIQIYTKYRKRYYGVCTLVQWLILTKFWFLKIYKDNVRGKEINCVYSYGDRSYGGMTGAQNRY